MSLFPVCEDDPLMKAVREATGGGVPVRVPEEKFHPLDAAWVRGPQAKYKGPLRGYLTGNPDLSVMLHSSDMASVSAAQSNEVRWDLGLQILEGLLKGVGAEGVGLKLKEKKISKVSFAVSGVKRLYVEQAELSRALAGQAVDAKLMIAKDFLEYPESLRVIDSVMTSSAFTMRVDASSAVDFRLDVPVLEELLAAAKVRATAFSNTGHELHFEGANRLVFAVSWLTVGLNAKTGAIETLHEPRSQGGVPALSFMYGQQIATASKALLTTVPVSATPGLLEWD